MHIVQKLTLVALLAASIYNPVCATNKCEELLNMVGSQVFQANPVKCLAGSVVFVSVPLFLYNFYMLDRSLSDKQSTSRDRSIYKEKADMWGYLSLVSSILFSYLNASKS